MGVGFVGAVMAGVVADSTDKETENPRGPASWQTHKIIPAAPRFEFGFVYKVNNVPSGSLKTDPCNPCQNHF